MKVAFFLMSFVFSVAQAGPSHTLRCQPKKSGAREQQLFFSIEKSRVDQGVGKLTLSDWSETRELWVPFLQTGVRASVSFGTYRGQPAIRGLKLAVDESRQIQVQVKGEWDAFGGAAGEIISSVPGFLSRNRVEPVFCTYVLLAGTRPALTGSN